MSNWRYGKDVAVTCNVILDPEKAFYNPGDAVQGYVVLSNPKYVLYYGCKVVLEGNVLVKFKEGNLPHHRTETFLKKFEFADGNGKTKILLTPPKTELPFSIQLPTTTLPGSCMSEYGMVLYQVVAYVHNSRVWFKRGEAKFSVNAILDLPKSPAPLIFEKSTTIKLNKEPYTLKLTLTCDEGSVLYAGQEDILFRLCLENPGGFLIINIGIALIQKITFDAGPTKIVKAVVATTELGETSDKSPDLLASLKIPPKTRPTQHGLITIEYFLKVIAAPEGQPPDKCLKCEIPVTICSKGIQDDTTVTHQLSPRNPSTHRRASSPMTSNAAIQMQHADAPPPCYWNLNLTRSKSTETLPPGYEDALEMEFRSLLN